MIALVLMIPLALAREAIATDTLSISLYPQINVEANSLRIDGIGRIVGREEIRKRVAAVEIDKDQLLAYSRKEHISKDAILAVVTSRVRHITEDVVVVGPTKIKISDATRLLGADEMKPWLDQIHVAVSSQFAGVEIVLASNKVVLPSGKKGQWRLRPIDVERISSSLCAWLELYDGGRVHASVPFWVKVNGTRIVPVVNKAYARGTVLNKADISYQPRSLESFSGKPALLDDSAEYVVSHLKKVGDVLAADEIYRRPDVLEGEHITVRSLAGAVVIVAKAVALSEGRMGDNVAVKMAGNDQIVHGYVSGRGVVEVGGI